MDELDELLKRIKRGETWLDNPDNRSNKAYEKAFQKYFELVTEYSFKLNKNQML
jgi:hypothetical protein